MSRFAAGLSSLFSARAEVIPSPISCEATRSPLLRTRGGHSEDSPVDSVEDGSSPHARRSFLAAP